MKILIAEDNVTTRRILKTILVKWNYDVVSACDGNEAWQKLQEKDPPKLIILDWMMPGINGVEICRRLRQADHVEVMYIILLTARDEKNDIVEGLGAGADDYIAKPFDTQELRARIDVGRRVVELQTALLEKEKLQVIFEMTGAICHELTQPMQAISGNSELMLLCIQKDNPLYRNAKAIKEQVERMGDITRKLKRVTRYKTKDYINSKIIDLDSAAAP
ncbi:MAG: response regulator [Desulfobacteraceae bacterium]|nr:response regulator [Desulfobacteraceae bacterium]MDH3572859.1 response regulator [Desulfobacteraceae bacterium]MDH3721498.1 response regulator [Desulfobacteraceae bacterium]MDH3873721.1 response regulator [Desulfobacteraceae bacterium]MDH3956920.1 response regulator [Desulfobacteraceae bacterium]